MKSNAVQGFTLIEMMMVLSIAAILLTVAVPSYMTFTKNSRITSQINEISVAINSARSEAAKTGVRTVVCQSDDPLKSSPSCGGTAKDWSKGWFVFIDADGDGAYDGAPDEYVVTKAVPELGVDVFTSNNISSAITFLPDGSKSNTGESIFAVCDERGKDKGKQITVASTGRPNVNTAASCTPT